MLLKLFKLFQDIVEKKEKYFLWLEIKTIELLNKIKTYIVMKSYKF